MIFELKKDENIKLQDVTLKVCQEMQYGVSE